MGDVDFRYYAKYPESECRSKMVMYAGNMMRFDLAFDMFGVQKFQGHHDRTLRRMAADSLIEIRRYLGTDRLVISDTMAIVPNYYARLENKDLSDLLVEDDPEDLTSDEHPLYLDPSGDVHLTYTVGFELVLRDFRNYVALADTIKDRYNRMYIMHSALRKDPPVRPNVQATSFDIPMGMVADAEFDPVGRTLSMTVKGLNGETSRFELGTAVEMKTIGAMIDQLIMNEDASEAPTMVDQKLMGILKLTQGK